MTLALSIIQARVNNERQLDEMTVDKAVAVYQKYGNFPPVFTYKGLKFIKYGESDSKATQAKFARVIREIDQDDQVSTREFEYVNHGADYKGFSIALETSENARSNDAICNVQVSDIPSRDFRIDRQDGADHLKAELDRAIAKIDALATRIPSWANAPIMALGYRIKLKAELKDDGSLQVRGRQHSTLKAIQISHNTSEDFIKVVVVARPTGQPSRRTFELKIPVAVAESGKLASKINELCAAKKIYAQPPAVELTTVSVSVGDVKREFKVKDAVAFKKHLLQYLKGN